MKPIHLSLVCLLSIGISLSACRPQPQQVSPAPGDPSTPTPSAEIPTAELDTPTPTAEPTAAPSPTPTAPSAEDTRTRYTLLVEFDYAQHSLDIHQSTMFTNTSGAAIPNLLFLIEPNRLGQMSLDQLSIANQPVQDYTLDGDRLEIPLAAPLAPGQSLQIDCAYQVTLPAIPPPSDDYKPVPYGYTDRQTNLVDWYFFLPPYRVDGGWLAHDPGYYGEFLVYDKANFDVTIRPVGSTQNLTFAGSAEFTPENGAYHAVLEDGRAFAWSASSAYEMASQVVGDTTVYSYYFPIDRLAGQRVLQDTASALALYSNLFGPYHHPSLTVVEADFLDGMEYDGMYFLSKGFFNLYDGTPKGYLTMIAVHETSHQWWFAQVGNDQAEEPWLDEAMATYSERLYYESTYPDLVDWWWSYRVSYYDPTGFINQPIYFYHGFEPYRNAVYLNGARFLEDLRKAVGDEAFFAFLKGYVTEFSDQISSTQGFFDVLSRYSSVDLSAVKAKYFLGGS